MTLIKPFLTNEGHLNHQDIMIFQGKKSIANETERGGFFNNHCINIVEKSFYKKQDMKHVIIKLLEKYKKIRKKVSNFIKKKLTIDLYAIKKI